MNNDELTDAEAAHRYRLQQAQEMLDLYELFHGKKAKTMAELMAWMKSEKGKAFFEATRRSR